MWAFDVSKNTMIAALISLLGLVSSSLISCTRNSNSSNLEGDPYEDVPPLFDGDSLLKVYPLALEGNIIQQEDFEKAMCEQILKYVGKHVECFEIQPWKVDEMLQHGADSFYVSFVRIIPRADITISTKLPRSVAANLDKNEWHEVTGTFIGFPPIRGLQPHIGSGEIQLGCYEFDCANVKVYPKEKRSYWEKCISDLEKY